MNFRCILIILALFTTTVNAAVLRTGVGLAYSLFLFGDMRDYFRNNVNYIASFHYLVMDNRGLIVRMQYGTYDTDDVRRSSHLKLFQFGAGYFQEVLSSQHTSLELFLSPDLYIYDIKNHLSSDYASHERRAFLGLAFGLDYVLQVRNRKRIIPFLELYAPKLNFRNTYANLGLKFDIVF